MRSFSLASIIEGKIWTALSKIIYIRDLFHQCVAGGGRSVKRRGIETRIEYRPRMLIAQCAHHMDRPEVAL